MENSINKTYCQALCSSHVVIWSKINLICKIGEKSIVFMIRAIDILPYFYAAKYIYTVEQWKTKQ